MKSLGHCDWNKVTVVKTSKILNNDITSNGERIRQQCYQNILTTEVPWRTQLTLSDWQVCGNCWNTGRSRSKQRHAYFDEHHIGAISLRSKPQPELHGMF